MKTVSLIFVLTFIFVQSAIGGEMYDDLLGKNEKRAGEVHLTWDDDSTVHGYKVFYGTASKNYTEEIDVGTKTSCLIKNLKNDVTYYFSVKSYRNDGKMSRYAKEIVHTVKKE